MSRSSSPPYGVGLGFCGAGGPCGAPCWDGAGGRFGALAVARLRGTDRHPLLRRPAGQGLGGRPGLGLRLLRHDRAPRLRRLALPLGTPTVEPGRDHGHPHLVAERVVDGRTEDDVRLRVDRVGHHRRRLVDLEQAQVGPARDREQHAVGAVDRLLEQRAGDRHLGRRDGTVLTARRADAHQRRAGVGHHGLHVGEVEVDQARGGDQVGDARDALEQHLVGLLERVEHADAAVGDREQLVVGDHDQGVDLFAEAGDALLRGVRATTALERERPGHDTDRQGTEGPGDLGHDGRAAGAGAAALARGHEHHVGALDDFLDLLPVVLGGLRAHVGVGAGAEAPGQLAADVELDIGVTHQQGLRIGVDRDELHALQTDLDHPVDGVDSTSTNTHDLDHGQVVLWCCHGGCLSYGRKRVVLSGEVRPGR